MAEARGVLPLRNLLGPLSRVVGYIPATKHGFLVKPASEEFPNGWGDPFKDSQGEPVPAPGSPGGSKNTKYVCRPPEQSWSGRITPGDQLYGEIDWRGPREKSEGSDPGSVRVSFHGPTSRYFRQDRFRYGSVDDHKRVYSAGACIAIAPFPVLGACLRKEVVNETTTKWWLFVVCGQSQTNYVLKREYRGVTHNYPLSNEDIEELSSVYDEKEQPFGWIQIAQFDLAGTDDYVVLEASTPWFFNESGTVASCIREVLFKFNNGQEDVEEMGYASFDMLVSHETVTVSEIKIDPMFTVTVKTETVKHEEEFFVGPVGALFQGKHWYQLHEILVDLTLTGSVLVAVDYDGDVKIEGRLKYNIFRRNHKLVYLGVDNNHPGDYYSESNFNTVSGVGLIEGQQPEMYNGTSSDWMGRNDLVTLNWSSYEDRYWLLRSLSGSLSEFLTGESDGDNVTLYFDTQWRMHVHFLDMRDSERKHLSTYFLKEELRTIEGAVWYVQETDRECINLEIPNRTNGVVENVYRERVHPKEVLSGGDTIPISKQWTRSNIIDNYTYPISSTLSLRSRSAKYPTWTTEEGFPVFEGFWYNTRWIFPWASAQELLSGEYCYREMGHGVDDYGNRIISMKNKGSEGEDVYDWYLSNGNLPGLVGGGEWFYPIGVV